MFHSGQVLVLRIAAKTTDGGARMRVLARTVKVPQGPWVGTGIGGTRDNVTGDAAEVVGSEVRGYG